jgi:hypothetical protein
VVSCNSHLLICEYPSSGFIGGLLLGGTTNLYPFVMIFTMKSLCEVPKSTQYESDTIEIQSTFIRYLLSSVNITSYE